MSFTALTLNRTKLERKGKVFVLTMTKGDNRFVQEFMKEMHQLFDVVESTKGAAALVITGEGKFFSNGLDIASFMAEPAQAVVYLSTYQKLLARTMTLNLPTVAAVNGHAFAGGCMFAFACDFRFMREDRGFFCLPEVDLGFDLTDGMVAIIKERITDPRGIRDMILLGKRVAATEAKQIGIVDRTASMVDLLPVAINFAESIADKSTKRDAFKILKQSTYRGVTTTLCEPPSVSPPHSKL